MSSIVFWNTLNLAKERLTKNVAKNEPVAALQAGHSSNLGGCPEITSYVCVLIEYMNKECLAWIDTLFDDE